MFCPECRRYWNAPADLPGAGKSKRLHAAKTCQVCGSLLARDRLVSEFPPSEQAQLTGRVADRRLTVEDVLRETAGDRAPSPDGLPPLDDRLLRRPLLPGRHKQVAWDQEYSPSIPREFRSWHARHAGLDLILGLGALASILLMIVAITMHALFTNVHKPTHVLKATVERRSALGKTSSIQPVNSAAAGLLPNTIGSWNRLETDTEITPVQQDGVVTYSAAYVDGTRSIHSWIERTPSRTAASSVLQRMLRQTETVHTPAGNEIVQPQAASFWGRQSVYFDIDNAESGASGSTAAPGMAIYPHTRSFVAGSDIVTVSSDTAANRDGFSRDLILKH